MLNKIRVKKEEEKRDNKLRLSYAKLSSAGVELSFVIMVSNRVGQHCNYI